MVLKAGKVKLPAYDEDRIIKIVGERRSIRAAELLWELNWSRALLSWIFLRRLTAQLQSMTTGEKGLLTFSCGLAPRHRGHYRLSGYGEIHFKVIKHREEIDRREAQKASVEPKMV